MDPGPRAPATLCPGRRAGRQPALRPGREGQRPRVRGPAGRGLRRLRERGLRRGPPPARLHCGAAPVPAECGGAALAKEVEVLGGLLAASPARPSWPWSAGPRWRTSSRCSRCWRPRWTRWSWAAAWPSPSWPPRASASAARCWIDDARRGLPGPAGSGIEILAAHRHPGAGARADLRSAGGGRGHAAASRSSSGDLPDGWTGLDIGPETAARLRRGRAVGRHRAVERAARAPSRTPASPRAPGWWPRPWPTARVLASSVAATAPARSRSWA